MGGGRRGLNTGDLGRCDADGYVLAALASAAIDGASVQVAGGQPNGLALAVGIPDPARKARAIAVLGRFPFRFACYLL